jgi:hypothetical protein
VFSGISTAIDNTSTAPIASFHRASRHSLAIIAVLHVSDEDVFEGHAGGVHDGVWTLSQAPLHALHVAPHPELYATPPALHSLHFRAGMETSHLLFGRRPGIGDAQDPVRLPHVVQVAAHEEPAVPDHANGVGDGLYGGE